MILRLNSPSPFSSPIYIQLLASNLHLGMKFLHSFLILKIELLISVTILTFYVHKHSCAFLSLLPILVNRSSFYQEWDWKQRCNPFFSCTLQPIHQQIPLSLHSKYTPAHHCDHLHCLPLCPGRQHLSPRFPSWSLNPHCLSTNHSSRGN